MGYIFWGYFCILFSINFTVGSGQIGLPPVFLGYILLFLGLSKMESKSLFFQKGKPIAMLLTVFCFLEFLGIIPRDIFDFFILIGIILVLNLDDKIICGICDIEEKQCMKLGGKSLRKVWYAKAVLSICAALLLILHSEIVSVLLLARVIAEIVFLVFIYRAYRAKKGCEGQTWINRKQEE